MNILIVNCSPVKNGATAERGMFLYSKCESDSVWNLLICRYSALCTAL